MTGVRSSSALSRKNVVRSDLLSDITAEEELEGSYAGSLGVDYLTGFIKYQY